MFESTFKNQALTALEEASSQIQNQASTAFEEITSPIQDQVSTILESNPVQDQSCGKSTKRKKQICADSSTTKAKDHLPHEVPCGPISTFKIKPRRPLKKFQTKVQEQASTALEEISSSIQDHASTALEEISSPIQDQASTALEEISSPIQDQASTALGSTSTVRDFKTHLLHATSTCIQCVLKWAHL
ncbi:hypothetical protein ACFX2A_006472 [Malus domestica]